jgi:cation diffusion facilitator CzcD-associated flavoprotein CzcO
VAPLTLAIIGAGPFGLAQAAWAADAGIDYAIIGYPMQFWREHMPEGMLLRSTAEWHLDPPGEWTMDRFFAERGGAPTGPLARERYLEYTDWLQQRRGIHPVETFVEELQPPTSPTEGFTLSLANGGTVQAPHVVVALGFGAFAHTPADLVGRLPRNRWAHTADAVDFDRYEGRRVLIVGGRQSAFEWAALLSEAGAAHVDVVYRHESPRFAESEWEWVDPLVAQTEVDPTWFRRLDETDKQDLSRRLWAEGRLKLEPWLGERLRHARVTLRPGTEIARTAIRPDGAIDVTFTSSGETVVDDLILATGYKVDISRMPLLNGPDGPIVKTREGFPVLDDHFQSSVPRLFITSMAASGDFGPFFGFTVSARVSARQIGRAILHG